MTRLLAWSVIFNIVVPSLSSSDHCTDTPKQQDDDAAAEEVATTLLQTGTNVKVSGIDSLRKSADRDALYAIKQELRLDKRDILEQSATFVSNNGLLCVEGEIKTAIGALALKSAGLHGAMYNESRVRSSTDCSSQGYSRDAGDDPTYVGVKLFFRSADEQQEFTEAEADALETFREQNGLSEYFVSLMSQCTAHLESQVGLSVSGQCGPVNNLRGSWMHHDLVDRDFEQICDDGPFQRATFALATLKTTRQYPQHPYDQIKLGSCHEYGFSYPSEAESPPDHCFAHFSTPFPVGEAEWEMHCFADPDRMFDAVMEDEAYLFQGDGFQEQAQELGLDPDVIEIMSVQGCHCLPTTEVMLHTLKDGSCSTPEELPAIRTWWSGE